MSLNQIKKDSYGYDFELTWTDVDTDTADDISAYTTAQAMIFADPDGNETEKSASFKTDGSDGIVTYTVESGLFDETGNWQVRLKVQSATAAIYSQWISFPVCG